MLNENNLHKYQLRGVDHILNHPESGLFLDMGLGKTITTLTAVSVLLDNFEVSKVLVIAPKKVVENVWTSELEEWEHIQHLRMSQVIGTERKRKEALRADADIYLVSRDNVAWLCGQYGGGMLPFDMLVIDESSSFKNQSSVRFKSLKQVLPSFVRKVILTGTPVPNNLVELWPQMFILDGGERLGKTITSYRKEYFHIRRENGYSTYTPLKDTEKEVYGKIEDIVISMKSEDYLDLPGSVVRDVKIEFSASLMEQYKGFEREKVLELFEQAEDEGAISAVNAAALSNKLLQFANGAIYDENRNVHQIHDLKLDELERIIEEANGQPVLVAWAYQHDRDRILQRLKKYNVRQLKNNQDIMDWNAGKIEVMTMHPASGGHGLNLQKGGHNIVWFGLSWSSELYKQFNTRLDRQGQTHQVQIFRLISQGTFDNRVVKALAKKGEGHDSIMAALNDLRREYKKELTTA